MITWRGKYNNALRIGIINKYVVCSLAFYEILMLVKVYRRSYKYQIQLFKYYFFCDRYSPHYLNYINTKLSKYTIPCIKQKLPIRFFK